MRNLSPNTTEEQLRELFASAVAGAAAAAAPAPALPLSLWNLGLDSSPAGFGASAQSPVTKVKVIRDYAFVHFQTRELALLAQRVLDSTLASLPCVLV